MNLILTLLVVTLTLASPMAWAQSQTVNATITEIDSQNNTITVEPVSKDSGMPKSIELIVKKDTDLKGINSVKDLSVGEEVRFEANRQDAWFADSLESAGEARKDETAENNNSGKAISSEDEPDGNIFSRTWNNIKDTFFSYGAAIPVNPDHLQEHAQNYIGLAEDQIQKLRKEITESTDAEKQPAFNQQASGDAERTAGEQEEASEADAQQSYLKRAERSLDAARSDLKLLKETPAHSSAVSGQSEAPDETLNTDNENTESPIFSEAWNEARERLNNSLDNLKDSVLDAADQILPEKEAYEMYAQYKIADMKFDSGNLEEAAGSLPERKKNLLEPKLKALKEDIGTAEELQSKLNDAGDNEWRRVRTELKDLFHSFRVSYSDTASKF